MTKQELKKLFSQKYDRQNWQNIIRDIFPNVSLFSEPFIIPVSGSFQDRISNFLQLGNVRLNDGKSIKIFELQVTENVNLPRNKVEMRNLIAIYIDLTEIHGVLAIFDSSEEDYRFTFTSKESEISAAEGFKITEIDAKRYTYLLGPNEPCRTAADQLFDLSEIKTTAKIEDVIKAFSIEKLSKLFFKDYKEQYEKFVYYITGKRFVKKSGKWTEEQKSEPSEFLESVFGNDEKKARDFIKKTLGRIVFLHFLQKKGWMGCPLNSEKLENGDKQFISNYFHKCSDKEHFYSRYLVPLFFECLNKKRVNDIFEITGSRIPYLNGGLFENKTPRQEQIDFPTNYWESLFEFFAQYNFTIDENDPFEQEVGIDPEMLGHIFENLLEDNKDKGAFYTPKPIVDYMCKESLIQYLKTHLLENSPLSEGCDFSRGVFKEKSQTKPDGILKKYKELPYNPKLKERAKKLRKAGNLSEVLFWNQIKQKKFNSLDFHRQKIIGNYIVDFYCPELNLVVEIDGESHNDKVEYDKERDSYFQSLGLKVLHFDDLDIKKNLAGVIDSLKEFCSGFENTPPDKSGTPLQEGNLALQAIENFIRNHDYGNPENKNNYIRNNAEKIEKLLDDVKICDPAIGSGAFPMGILKEIFWAKMTLDWTLNPAKVKKQIIQNSIYGVDIDSGAIDIARLRFWLSLIVDAEEPEPLPNLDYKIMQGNSLLESFEGIDLSKVMKDNITVETVIDGEQDLLDFMDKNPQQQIVFTDDRKQKVEELKKHYFEESDIDIKKQIHKQIDRIVLEHIENCLEKHKDNLQLEIANLTRSIKNKAKGKNQATQDHLWNDSSNGKLLKKFQQELNQVDDKYKKLEKLQYSTDRPFFLWHLYFSDVFYEKACPERSRRSGFDIVIGNPPYVEHKKLKGLSSQLKNKFLTYSGTADLYVYFYEKGIKILRQKGILIFITSNKFVKTRYGKNLRQYFAKYRINEIIDFTDVHVFEALVASCIFSISRSDFIDNKIKIAFANDSLLNFSSVSVFVDNDCFLMPQKNLNKKIWQLENETKLALKEKIEDGSVTFKETRTINIYRGVTTGYNPAFIIDEEKRKKLILEDITNEAIIKPLLQGRNIRKWVYQKSNTHLLQTGYDLNIKKDYPSIYQHLLQFKTNLEIRADQGKKWWNLRACKYYDEFEKEKIIWGLTADKWAFSYDNEKYYLPSSGYILTSKEISIKYLLALVNSDLMEFYFKFIGIMTAGGAFTLKHETIVEFPIKLIDQKKNQPFIQSVDQILIDKKEGKDTQILEDKIDLMVYKLYELTYEEVKIVDPDFALSKKEYEKFKL